MADDLQRISFPDAAAWERWLERYHTRSQGVWVQIAKKRTGIESVRYPDVLDLALCFGWIDGRREGLDEFYFLQRFTPRRPRSRWSRVNRDKVERLAAEGRMRPAGLQQVERAKADGRWDAAYFGQARATIPDDLYRALDARPRAKEKFEHLGAQERFGIIDALYEAKRPETRERRLRKFLGMLDECDGPHA